MNLTLFDLDGTLLPNDSDHAFGTYMVDIGWAEGNAWRTRNDAFFEQYQRGELDVHAYVDFATTAWRGRPLADAEAARARFMQTIIAPSLLPAAQALVDEHRRAGDLLAIVTATNAFVTRPIATAFGVDNLLAVDLERDAAGRYTGRIEGVPTFREGKVVRVQAWLQSRGQRWEDFAEVTFYSDSMNDLPLLELASRPVATNPTPALRAVAQERGWRILRLFEQ